MATKRTITKDEVRQAIAKNLRETRASFELTQLTVAEMFNPPLTRAAIAQWEVGETLPDVDRLAVLSKAFGVTIDSLVFGPERIDGGPQLTSDAVKVARKFMELRGKQREIILSLVQSMK